MSWRTSPSLFATPAASLITPSRPIALSLVFRLTSYGLPISGPIPPVSGSVSPSFSQSFWSLSWPVSPVFFGSFLFIVFVLSISGPVSSLSELNTLLLAMPVSSVLGLVQPVFRPTRLFQQRFFSFCWPFSVLIPPSCLFNKSFPTVPNILPVRCSLFFLGFFVFLLLFFLFLFLFLFLLFLFFFNWY